MDFKHYCANIRKITIIIEIKNTLKKIITLSLITCSVQAAQSNYTIYIPFKENGINFVTVPDTNPENPNEETEIIGSSSISKTSITRGESVTISWNYNEADTVVISGVGTYTQKSGSVNIKPTTTTSYSINVSKGTKTKNETLNIEVIQPAPQISLTASSYKIGVGKSSTINWSVLNSDDISINEIGNKLANTGSYSVTPTNDTTYTLIAKGYENIPEESKSITIQVIPDAVINSFDVNQSTFNKGETAVFTWDVSNASKITLNGTTMPLTSNTTSVKLYNAGTIDYELVVTSLSGAVTKQTKTLTVNDINMITLFNVNGAEQSTVTTGSTTLKFTWDMVTPKTLKITNDRGWSVTVGVASKSYNYTYNHPVGNTVYTLEATNESGEKFTKTVTVKSVAAPVITSATGPSSIYIGESYTIDWTATGAIRYTLRSDDAGTGIPKTDTEFESGTSFIVPDPAAANNLISIYLTAYNEAGASVSKLIRYSAVDSPTIAIPIINGKNYNTITVAPNTALVFTTYSMSSGATLYGRDSTNSYDVPFPTNAPATPGVYEYYMSASKTVGGVTKYSNLLKATVTVQ